MDGSATPRVPQTANGAVVAWLAPSATLSEIRRTGVRSPGDTTTGSHVAGSGKGEVKC